MKPYVTKIYFKKNESNQREAVYASDSEPHENKDTDHGLRTKKVISDQSKDNEQFPTDLNEWQHFENENYAFMSIVTHE